jgi:hypothetical protein
MRNTKLFLVVSLGLLAFITTTPAFAQTTTSGAIQGVVRDKANGNGISDVTVVATSPALQGSASELTDAQGTYLITNLPPGNYEVVFYYGEIKIRQANVTVGIGKVTPVTIKMDTAATGGEVIDITQKAPTIDVGSTKQGITIGQDYTKNIPLAGRTFEGSIGAAAGAQGDALGISFSGSTSVENNYVIDGINTTGLTYGTVGSPLINDFIQETEVITGGYNAEFGRSTGGVVNVVTKSGGNEFHGTVFANLLPLQGKADPIFTAGSAISGKSNLDYQLDFGFDIGGPIVKDKVWFYVGFAPFVNSNTVTRIVGTRVDRMVNNHDYVAQPDGDDDPATAPFDAQGHPCELTQTCESDGKADINERGFQIFEEIGRKEFNANSTQYLFTAKVNFAVNPDNQGQISVIGSPSSSHTAGVIGTPGATQIDNKSNATDASVKWNSKFMNNKTEVDVILGWHHSSTVDSPIKSNLRDTPRTVLRTSNLGAIGRNADQAEDRSVLDFCTDNDPLIADPFKSIVNCPIDTYVLDGPGNLDDITENRYTGKATVTQRVTAAGHHQFKAGLDFEDNYLKDFSSLSGGKQYQGFSGGAIWEVFQYVHLDQNADPTMVDSCVTLDPDTGARVEHPCDYLTEFKRSTNTFNWAGFAQDSWQILPNFTLNAGLRYEEQRLRAAEQIRNYVDPLTGKAIGANALTLDGLIAPRIGLLYDWTKEGRSKIYGNWGRFYESIPMDINNRAFGGETFYQAYFDGAAGGQCGTNMSMDDSTPRIPSLPTGCPTNLRPHGDGSDDGTNTPQVDAALLGGGDASLYIPPGMALLMPGLGPQYMDETVLGVEYELFEDLRVGASYQNRSLGRVIEDLSTDGANTYVISNPGTDVDTSDLVAQMNALPMNDPKRDALQKRIDMFEQIKTFDKPRRDYNAFQLTAFKRFSNHFFIQASYTYSKLQGNYPGLFAADNGQLDPNITSQYDLIELLANREGDLPADRPHNLKFDGYYTLDLKEAGEITAGGRLRAQSGIPINTLGRHALYGPRESFILPRGEWGRTEFVTQADLRLQYSRPVGKNMKLAIYLDIYNVFDTQTETNVDAEYTIERVNPIVGGSKDDLPYLKSQLAGGVETGNVANRKLNYANTSARLTPITSRFGLRLEF